MVDDPNVRVT